MRRLALLVVLLALIAAPGAEARTPVVEPWIEVTLEEVKAQRTTPPRAARALAYVSVAVRDAAVRAARQRRPVRPAVAAAAREMLTELFGDVRARPLPRAPRGAAARMGRAAARPLLERLPLLTAPPFPAYPSGHAATSGAAATVLEALWPTHLWDLRQAAEEAALSRIYGGIHFPMDGAAGLELGRRVARVALART